MKNSLGDKLKSLRRARFLTQQNVANDLEIGQSTYAQYETNQREPNFESLEKLAKYYGVTVSFLVSNNDETDEELAKIIAETIGRNRKMRILFDKARFLSDKNLDLVVDLVKTLSNMQK